MMSPMSEATDAEKRAAWWATSALASSVARLDASQVAASRVATREAPVARKMAAVLTKRLEKHARSTAAATARGEWHLFDGHSSASRDRDRATDSAVMAATGGAGRVAYARLRRR